MKHNNGCSVLKCVHEGCLCFSDGPELHCFICSSSSKSSTAALTPRSVTNRDQFNPDVKRHIIKLTLLDVLSVSVSDSVSWPDQNNFCLFWIKQRQFRITHCTNNPFFISFFCEETSKFILKKKQTLWWIIICISAVRIFLSQAELCLFNYKVENFNLNLNFL